MTKAKIKQRIPNSQIEAAEAEIIDRSKRIEFYTTEYSVELLVNKMEKEEFVIPDYQREFNWNINRQSKFIESVAMGLPIPFLFFWEMDNGKLEIVDGSQRLRTLQAYINNELTIKKLEELPALNNTRFEDLKPSRQRKILNKSIRGIVLNENADDQARFDMFERINTSSMTANSAEVRRGALRGPFQSLVEELALLPLFSELAPVSKKSKNERIPEELVTRFFAYGDGLEDYRNSPKDFIFTYTKRMNTVLSENPDLKDNYTARFNQMLTFIQRTFPNGFAKPTNLKSTPRARFEAIAIGSDLAIKEDPNLLNSIPDVQSWLSGAEFKQATTSDAANVKSKLEKRIKFVKDNLLG